MNVNIFAPITKVVTNEDGSRSVYGMLTGPQLDLDGQGCDPEWLKTAVPEWFETGANIRLMHQPIAIGKGKELDAMGDDWWLESKVVDPHACKLLDEEILLGYSIGIKGMKIARDARFPNGRIIGGKIVESSLVDRGSNESSKLITAKAANIRDDAPLVPVEIWVKDASMDTGGSGTDPEAEEVNLLESLVAAAQAWLAQEAQEVADGTGSVMVVRMICNLLNDLEWTADADAYDDAQALLESVKTVIINKGALDMATIPEITKGLMADDDAAKAARADLVKSLAPDIAAAIGYDADANTELTAKVVTLGEGLTAVQAEITKVGEMAAPGGPELMGKHRLQATDTETQQIEKFEQLSKSVSDRDLAAAYATRAQELRDTISKRTTA